METPEQNEPEDLKEETTPEGDNEGEPSGDSEVQKKYDALVAKVNDPAFIKGSYIQHYGDIPAAAAPVPTPDPDPEPPNFDNVDYSDMTPAEVAKEISRQQAANNDHLKQALARQRSQMEQETSEREAEAAHRVEVEKVESFAKSKADFNEHTEAIRQLYAQRMSIEDAYDLVIFRKAKEHAAKNGDKTPRRNAARASRSPSPQNAKKVFKTVDQASAAAFDEVAESMTLVDENV